MEAWILLDKAFRNPAWQWCQVRDFVALLTESTSTVTKLTVEQEFNINFLSMCTTTSQYEWKFKVKDLNKKCTKVRRPRIIWHVSKLSCWLYTLTSKAACLTFNALTRRKNTKLCKFISATLKLHCQLSWKMQIDPSPLPVTRRVFWLPLVRWRQLTAILPTDRGSYRPFAKAPLLLAAVFPPAFWPTSQKTICE